MRLLIADPTSARRIASGDLKVYSTMLPLSGDWTGPVAVGTKSGLAGEVHVLGVAELTRVHRFSKTPGEDRYSCIAWTDKVCDPEAEQTAYIYHMPFTNPVRFKERLTIKSPFTATSSMPFLKEEAINQIHARVKS